MFLSPVKAVFGHLADPSRLGDWLPEITAADPGSSDGTGADFPLIAHVDGIEVAAELFISRKAVEYHLGNIYAKCGVPGRQQLRRLVEQWRQPATV